MKIKATIALILVSLFFKAQDGIERSHRFKSKPEVVTYTNCKPIRLRQVFDTTKIYYVGILNDSIDNKNQQFVIYVYSLQESLSNEPELNIGLTNGSFIRLTPIRRIDSLNYFEFGLNSMQLQELKAYKFDYFSINTKESIRPWVDIKYSSKEYFKEFLNKNYYRKYDVEILSRYANVVFF